MGHPDVTRRSACLWLLTLGSAGCGATAASDGAAAPAPTSAPAKAIDRFVHRVIARLDDVPGIAVAVVRADSVVYLGGAGWADREARRPVVAGTPFYLASSTKSFTGLAASLLADRGRVDLDAPISRYLPELRLPPPRSADSVTLRQLLTHTMGLADDAVVIRTAYTGEHTPGQLIALLAGSEVIDRSFHYDNLGYVMAGLVLERVTGAPWQRVLDSTIFAPLRMRHTSAYMSRAEPWRVAVPYAPGPDGAPHRLERTKRDATMHPAGGVVSSAADLARWLEANLADGRLAGGQVLSARAVSEAHRLQVRLDDEQAFGPFRRFGYGLGWYWGTYEGDTLLHHFGGYPGARAHVSFMPRHGIGVAVLVNVSGAASDVADLVARYAYDAVLDKPGIEAHYDSLLSAQAAELAEARARLLERRAAIAARPSTLTLPPGAYAGEYRSTALGRLHVKIEGGRLRLALGPLDALADNYTRPDAVRVEFTAGSGEVVQFYPSTDRADSLSYAGYVFRR
ncbi:MAG TPA: serine hydrolase domain-containing protein [Gemmatimonadales bacterium]|nr:serine hydrolase domain-containing protein [Gemmatimonadales bacterium]